MVMVNDSRCSSNDQSCGYQAACDCRPSRKALMELYEACRLVDAAWDQDDAQDVFARALCKCEKESIVPDKSSTERCVGRSKCWGDGYACDECVEPIFTSEQVIARFDNLVERLKDIHDGLRAISPNIHQMPFEDKP